MTDRVGRAGGIARAASLSPGARRDIARQAARARWGGSAAPSPAPHLKLRRTLDKHTRAIRRHEQALREAISEAQAEADRDGELASVLEEALDMMTDR